MVVGVVVAKPQDLCNCSCGVFQSRKLQPLRAKDLEGFGPLHCSVLFQLLQLLLIQSVGAAGGVPLFLLPGLMLLRVPVAILLVQDVQQHMPLPCHVQIQELLEIFLSSLELE